MSRRDREQRGIPYSNKIHIIFLIIEVKYEKYFCIYFGRKEFILFSEVLLTFSYKSLAPAIAKSHSEVLFSRHVPKKKKKKGLDDFKTGLYYLCNLSRIHVLLN